MNLALRIVAILLLIVFTLAGFGAFDDLDHPLGWLGLSLIAWCASGFPWERYHRTT